MIPWHIQSRSQFVEQAHALCPTRAAQRAIREGRITLLGGFYDIPPFGKPGFICHVTSRHGRTWILALVRQLDRSFRGVYIENIPWENQVEFPFQTERWTLNGGDPMSSPHTGAKRPLSWRDVAPHPYVMTDEEIFRKLRGAIRATRFTPPDIHNTGERV